MRREDLEGNSHDLWGKVYPGFVESGLHVVEVAGYLSGAFLPLCIRMP